MEEEKCFTFDNSSILLEKTEKLCTRCLKKLRAQNGKARWCLPCRNDWEHENRKKYSQISKSARIKIIARAYLNVYIRRGKIKKQDCAICLKKAEGHHHDYSKPLEVDWLCRKHHLEKHKLYAQKH